MICNHDYKPVERKRSQNKLRVVEQCKLCRVYKITFHPLPYPLAS